MCVSVLPMCMPVHSMRALTTEGSGAAEPLVLELQRDCG